MKLFFRTIGSGPAMVILHGLFGSSDNWMSIARKLSEKYTVILPDLRNHGQSPHSEKHSYDALAEDVLELVDDLGLGKFILVGHSMGGRAAMKFAIRWPERLNALIIADISPFGNSSSVSAVISEYREILETIISVDTSAYSSRKEIENTISGAIESEMTRGFIMKNLGRDDKGKFEWKLNAKSLLENLAEITSGITDESTRHEPVTGFPVMFLRGERSDYINSDDSRKIMSLFPAAEIVTIKNAGHWLHADNPEAVEKILSDLT